MRTDGLATWVVVAALAVSWPASSQEEPPSESVDVDRTGDEEDEGDEADDARAPTPDGVREFDTVETKRVRPEALPSSSESEVPTVLRDAGAPGEPPSEEKLREMGHRVDARLYTVAAVEETQSPGDATPVVRKGHAIALEGGAEGPPILVTTLYWLSDASELYVLPPSADTEADEDETPSPQRRSLEETTASGTSHSWLDAHRDQLVEAHLYRPDRHRNLATVIPAAPERLDLPDEGLELFDIQEESPGRLYGMSPQTGTQPSETTIREDRPKARELQFYLQTGYAPTFGAPIVSSDGRVVALTAFDHPNKKGVVLAIPPDAIRTYVDEVLGTLDDAD